MSNVVDLLTLFLEKVTPSRDLTSEQWSNLVSTVKNTLDNSKDYISNSADPLVEGFSTILNAIVSNKYSTPGSNYYSALTLSRIGSFSSQSSTDSDTNASSSTSESDSKQSHSTGTPLRFLDRLRDDNKTSSTSSSSSESSGRRRGYSALVGTLKKLFLKEKLERLESRRSSVDEDIPKYKNPKEVVEVHSDDEKSSKKHNKNTGNKEKENNNSGSNKDNKSRESERKQLSDEMADKRKVRDRTSRSGEQPFIREPYPLRSLSPRPGSSKQPPSNNSTESPKKSIRDTSRPESMRMTFRDEMADKIPPLDLGSLRPHDHLTTPGDSDNTAFSLLTTVRNKLDASLVHNGHKDSHGNKSKYKEKRSKITTSSTSNYKDKLDKSNKEEEEDSASTKKRGRTEPPTDDELLSKQLKSKPGSPKVASPKRHTSADTVHKSKAQTTDGIDVQHQGETDLKEIDHKDKPEQDDKNKKRHREKEDSKDLSKDTVGEQILKNQRDEHKDIMYKPLVTLVDNVTRVDLYVVAVEMIRASVRTIDIRRDVFNYRAIDPSVLHTNDNVDYSVQIMSSDPKMAHHINFGDVLRLKRVDANFVVDKSGRKHINIILSLKNRPSMRLWHSNQSKELETERVNIDFNKPTDSTRIDFTNANSNNTNSSIHKDNSFDSSESNLNGLNNWISSNNTNRDTSTMDNKSDNTINTNDDNNKNNNSMGNTNNAKNDTGNKDKEDDNNDGSNKDKNNKKDSNGNAENDTTSEVSNSARESTSRSPMLKDYQLDPETVDEQIELLKKEAVVVFYDAKVTMTPKDVAIINFLKDWSRNLKPLDILGSSEYTKPLTESSNIPQDFIVKVIKVCPDQSLMVADSEAKAIVSNFDQILASNLFETCNPIKKGDWLKLRCFIRVFNESDRLIKLSATKFSCVTRIPPLGHRVIGEEHLNPENNHGILVRERRVNLEELSRTSCLNDSFPRRFKRSRDFIHKLLSKQPPVQFQKASPVRIPVEKEEGEISQ